MNKKENNDKQYPFIAPCRALKLIDPWRWLKTGLIDVRKAPFASLGYGLVMTMMVMSIFMVTWRYGSVWLILSLLCVFVFVAPIACVGLYAISAQLERGQSVSFLRTLRACLKHYLGSELIFILILFVVFLVWGRASSMISIFIPVNPDADVVQMAPYIASLVMVSALFLGIIFIASVFSLPMIMHRDVDMVTAVITSINAVLRNKLVMVEWAIIVLLMLLIGLLSVGIALIILLPTIGHAVWHGYLDSIDASQFPRHSLGITSTPR